MRKTELKKFEKVLLGLKERALNSIKKTLEIRATEKDLKTGDEGDEAAQHIQDRLSEQLFDRDVVLIQKIENALQRIKDGEYGECFDCGEDIGSKRLEIRPIATLCVKCQENEERNLARQARVTAV